MTEEKAEWHASEMVALDAGKFLAMQQELEQLRAERNPQGAYGTGHAITLATQRKVAELEAENERLRKELSAIQYAAHMPDDYEYGLPSWINQKLYMAYINRFDANGDLIPRTEDVEQIAYLQHKVADLEAENEKLRDEVAELKADSEKFLAEVTTMHLGLNDKRVEVQAENEGLQRTLRMVDEWIAATLPGSSSESMRAVIAEALRGEKPA